MKAFLFVLILSNTLVCFAQNSFQVRSSDDHNPLIGATAIASSVDGDAEEQIIADGEGMLTVSLALPFNMQINHIGYETITMKVTSLSQVILMTPSEIALDQVVITGQYLPQSAKNSVYKVRSIGAERIVAQNANSIYDILANELNVRISRDNATGRSGISLQGMGGQYTKVLVDGVPVIGKGGVSNDIDLAQIDMQSVQRIEIVEGPMAVNYGADALAGVINIISKKESQNKLEANVTLQSETVGKEYAPFEEGSYSPSASLGYKWHPSWYSRVNGRLYKFGGWQGSKEGRQKEWHPKNQWFAGFLTRYEKDNWEVYYKLDVMDELITSLGAREEIANKEPRAIDEKFHAMRYMHQVQSNLNLGKSVLNSIVSYSDYERLSTNYRKYLESGLERVLTEGNDTSMYRSLFSRNTFSGLPLSDKITLQAGVEATHETFNSTKLNEGDKFLTNVALFSSVEFKLNKLQVRPGLRYAYNSLYRTIPTPSINFSYEINDQTKLRWSYGRGFRVPAIRELFHEFVDSNHNLIGNPDLTPEYSHNLNLDITHELGQLPLSLNVSGFYNHVTDLIGIISAKNNTESTYTNFFKYRSVGSNLRTSYENRSVRASMGISYTGRYQYLSEVEDVPTFLFSPEVAARMQYKLDKANMQLSAFYKFNGSLNRFQLEEGTVVKRKRKGYQTLDINVSKSFGTLATLALGVRNLTNVTSIPSTVGGGAHGGGDSIPIGNGRSYFIRINYQFKQK